MKKIVMYGWMLWHFLQNFDGKKAKIYLDNGYITLDKAQCYGNGCHTVFKIDKYPQLFKYFQKLYYKYFPDEMYGTD